MTILVTGAAGFIGSNLVNKLCEANAEDQVIGIDNMNDYYDVSIKEYRLQEINKLGTTVLVVTHQMDLVEQFGNRVIAIDEGLVISDGMDGYRYEDQ